MSERDSFDLIDQLIERGVQLVVVCGHAVNFHGYVRATEDVDHVFARTSEAEKALLRR